MGWVEIQKEGLALKVRGESREALSRTLFRVWGESFATYHENGDVVVVFRHGCTAEEVAGILRETYRERVRCRICGMRCDQCPKGGEHPGGGHG